MRVLLLLISICFCLHSSFAQESPKCRLEIDKVDLFSADTTQLTQAQRIWRDFYEETFIKCAAVRKNKQCGLFFENYAGVEYRIQENDSLMFLLANDSILILKASTERLAERFNDKIYYAKVFYGLDTHAMALLMNQKVKAVRQYYQGGFFEHDLKDKKQDAIINMLSCIQ